MGNSAPQRLSGKVILSSGAIMTYENTITVAELMLEHPQEVVVEYQPVASGKKPIPLPADKKLEPNKLYLMIPVRKGKPVFISTDEARMLLSKTDSLLRSKALLSYTGIMPFLVRMGPIVGLKREDSNTMLVDKKMKFTIERKHDQEELTKSDYVDDILEGRPEFLSRQISGKSWKPSLDPIKEKAVKAKARHWLL